MGDTYAISALLDKRARKLGEIRANKFQAMRLRMELAQIDSVIRMFRPDQDVEVKAVTTFGKSPAALPKGTGTRLALDILRETGEPHTAEELATAVLIRAGKDPDPVSVAMMGKTIHSSFSRAKKPLAVYDRGTWPGKWRLNRVGAEAPTPPEP